MISDLKSKLVRLLNQPLTIYNTKQMCLYLGKIVESCIFNDSILLKHLYIYKFYTEILYGLLFLVINKPIETILQAELRDRRIDPMEICETDTDEMAETK